jgi:hypothetical protein
MLRGRCSCTIPARPTPSPRLFLLAPSHQLARRSLSGGGPRACQPQLQRRRATSLVSPIIPVHPRNSPVSPIIPVHTQKQGGGGHFSQDAFSPNSFVFSRHGNYILNYMNNNIVGAPTYCKCLTTARTRKNRSEDRPLQKRKHGPPRKTTRGANNAPQEDGPYKRCKLRARTGKTCILQGNNQVCRRADILECGGSPPLLRLTRCLTTDRLGKMDYIAKAGASSRTPKTAQERPASALRGSR